MPNTIIIKGDAIHKDAIANETITPGDLLVFVGGSAATASQLNKHATAGGNAQKMFADLQDYIGGGLTKTYASGDQVNYVVARRGDEINARLAASENAGIGTYLESNGDGTLRVHVPQSNIGSANILPARLVAIALASSNVGSVARLRVEVL